MGKIKNWRKIAHGQINGFEEWENTITKQRANFRPYTFGRDPKYKVIIEKRNGVEEGIVSNKSSAIFAVMRYMRSHPNG